MMELDFTFEASPWEALIAQAGPGGRISAAQFLTLTEGEPEELLQEALMELEIRHISLDISNLSVPAATGESAVRLRREEQLVKEGKLPSGLEENDPLRLYLEEIAAIADDADVQKMAAAYARGQDMIVERLTRRMLPAVVEMAYGFVGQGVLLMDLIQEGSLGLWQAILNYQSGDFMTHAQWYVEQYLAKSVMLQARELGFGQRMKQAMEDFRAVDERLLSDLGRNATLEEIADAMHVSLEEAENVAGMMQNARFMHRAKQENAPPEEDDPEETQHVEDTALFQSRQRIQDMLSGLTEKEAQLISLRFGLEGGLPMSPADTGKRLGLTAEEVVALEAAALLKMRDNDKK